ncbi:S1C family serine protease [Deinococcus knuensis]|nr:S1C family serine protease [Deinococcus knuensis]
MNASPAPRRSVTPARRSFLPGRALLGAMLALPLWAAPVAAQSAPAAAPGAAERRATTARPAPLTATEESRLQALFQKARPATLRIEQCVPTRCDDPDGVGSAVLISADGLALTAYHVVEGARNLSAQTLDRKRYAVEVVGYNDQDDLALLRVKVPAGTPFLPLATGAPGVGNIALAIGNGNGDFLRPKTGRLTGLDSDAGRADFPPGTLELSAPVVPGDSGGPVLNATGQVTGIVSYIRLEGRRSRAYAVPVTVTDARLTALKRGEKRDAPVIGIQLGGAFGDLFMLTEKDFVTLSRLLKLGDTPGAFFTGVSRGSPAEKAGLQPLRLDGNDERVSGDIVTAVNGKRIVNFSEFQYAVRAFQPGDTVTLTVLRGGKTLQVPVTLTGRSQVDN